MFHRTKFRTLVIGFCALLLSSENTFAASSSNQTPVSGSTGSACKMNPAESLRSTNVFASIPGQTIRIDAHGVCKTLRNEAKAEYAVPVGTPHEWLKFIENRPSSIFISECVSPAWTSSYGTCSAACGPGTQTRIDQCIAYNCKTGESTPIDASKCAGLAVSEPPTLACNVTACTTPPTNPAPTTPSNGGSCVATNGDGRCGPGKELAQIRSNTYASGTVFSQAGSFKPASAKSYNVTEFTNWCLANGGNCVEQNEKFYRENQGTAYSMERVSFCYADVKETLPSQAYNNTSDPSVDDWLTQSANYAPLASCAANSPTNPSPVPSPASLCVPAGSGTCGGGCKIGSVENQTWSLGSNSSCSAVYNSIPQCDAGVGVGVVSARGDCVGPNFTVRSTFEATECDGEIYKCESGPAPSSPPANAGVCYTLKTPTSWRDKASGRFCNARKGPDIVVHNGETFSIGNDNGCSNGGGNSGGGNSVVSPEGGDCYGTLTVSCSATGVPTITEQCHAD